MWPLIAGTAKPITLSHRVSSGGWESMISANGGLPAHRYTPQVTARWPRGSKPASPPPPPRRGPFWGRGSAPSAPGGRRVAAVALKLGGGERGGGVGGLLPRPRCPRPVGRRPAIRCLRRAPPGVYSCRGGCRAAVGVGRGPVGRLWVSAAGGGGRGGEPPRPGSRPRLLQAGL